jgi:hypothetical protein
VQGIEPITLLQQKCAACHGESSGMSGLKIDSRENLLRGGKRGPAVIPGKSGESLLFQAVARTGQLKMPPAAALTSDEVKVLQEWIDAGAEWRSAKWRAFEKPERPAIPPNASNRTAVSPIDAFINQKLRAVGVAPAPEADRHTLIRRASYDLLGLPPTIEQVDKFVQDKSPEAWEHVIDSLLASPRYGEKWGRHWLDLARYADTAGFEQDPYLLLAWRYRDYVVKSFNDDKPYDRFAKEQIAGDELFSSDPDARTGTGFYRVGTNRDMLFKVEDVNLVEKRTDMVDTTAAVFLGLTVGCARCHDHKFDPIPQKDYYRMQAIFQPVVSDRVLLDYNPARFYDIAENARTFKLWQISTEIANINRPYQHELKEKKLAALPPELQAAFRAHEKDRTPEQSRLVSENPKAVNVEQAEINTIMSQADKERMDAIARRLLQTFTGYGPPPASDGITDVGREAPKTFIAIRGNPDAPGEEVHPGFLTALGGGDIPEAPLHAASTQRRKAFAQWLTTADNPLFGRVMVNRIWQFHFGSGLAKSPSDFGIRGGNPTHPELLDWLATEFAAKGWRVKAMHKLIMMSDAYRRSANASETARANDPANELLSHMNRRRLEAEEVRDASLQVTGELNLKMGGVPVVPSLSKEEMYGMIGNPANSWMVTADASEHKRRSIYLLTRRTFQQPMAQAFDGPDGVLTCPRRNESTTAPQSLALLNSGFTMDRAKALGAQVGDAEAAWKRVYGRLPSAEEKAAAEQFLLKQQALLGSRDAAMAELIRGLMNTNEFLYVD